MKRLKTKRDENMIGIFNILKNLKRSSSGQALVEMALVLPIMLLLVMGIIEFGRIFNAYLILNEASREGARIAVVGGTDSSITTTLDNVTGTLDQTKITTTITPDIASRTKGMSVTVALKYDLELICPIVSSILPNPFIINSKAVMRME